MVLDQELRSLGDQAVERSKARRDVIVRVDPLADVVQQGRQQELLVVRPRVARQLEDLQQVIEHVPLGMMLRRLLHVLQRQQQHAEDLRTDRPSPRRSSCPRRGRCRDIPAASNSSSSRDRGPLDRLAGDRALEDVVGLVLGVDGQLEVEAVVDVDVREDARLAVLDDLLALDVELVAFVFEQVGDEADAVGEDVQVDVGALADVAGHDAADQPRPERAQQPHQAQGVEAHVPEVGGAFVAFVEAGEELDLVADLGVGGEVVGFDAAAAEALGGLAFGGEVFGLARARTSAGGFQSDRLAELSSAILSVRRYCKPHQCGAGLMDR